jgi:hypothetical protein
MDDWFDGGWPTHHGSLEASLARGPEEDPSAAGTLPQQAAATTEILLKALAPVPADAASKIRPTWPLLEERTPSKDDANFLSPSAFLGHWVDSEGNTVHVFSTDAFETRLAATLLRPSRHEIHLSIRPVFYGGGWQCGHSVLDPDWSSEARLHWVTSDGKLTVWVRMNMDANNDCSISETTGEDLAEEDFVDNGDTHEGKEETEEESTADSAQ